MRLCPISLCELSGSPSEASHRGTQARLGLLGMKRLAGAGQAGAAA
jgi:hypothetical protein